MFLGFRLPHASPTPSSCGLPFCVCDLPLTISQEHTMMALRTRTDNPEKSLHLKIFNFLTSAKLLSHEVTFTDSGTRTCALCGGGDTVHSIPPTPGSGEKGLEATGWLGFDQVPRDCHRFTDSANAGELVSDRGRQKGSTLERSHGEKLRPLPTASTNLLAL